MKRKLNNRNFAYYKFKAHNGVKCSLQKSSLATQDAIWLGADEIGLKEFVAGRSPSLQDVNLVNNETHHFAANNRMYLTRKQVKKLLGFYSDNKD